VKGKHFIFDFETLGTDLIRGFPVLECSYAVFNADRFTTNPYTFEELVETVIIKDKLEVTHQVTEFGYKIDPDTLAWWRSQDSSLAKIMLKPEPTDIRVSAFIDNVLKYLAENNQVEYWWSRSNTFDPIIMYRMCSDVGRIDEFNKALKHWNVRDTRTYIDAKFNFKRNMNCFTLKEWDTKFEKHNSIHDVAADILRLQKLVFEENS